MKERTRLVVDGPGRPERLRPQAQAIDTYVRPVVNDGHAKQLSSIADALGSLNPAISRLAALEKDKERRAEIEQNKFDRDAVDTSSIAQWTDEQLLHMLENDPTFYSDTLSVARSGYRLGEAWKNNDLVRLQSEWDVNNDGPLNDFLRSNAVEYANSLPPEAQKTFWTSVDPLLKTQATQEATAIAQNAVKLDQEGFVAELTTNIDNALAEGHNPGAIMEALVVPSGQLNKRFADHIDTNTAVFATAQSMFARIANAPDPETAQTYYDMGMTLLTHNREGIGQIDKILDFSVQSEQLKAAGDAALSKVKNDHAQGVVEEIGKYTTTGNYDKVSELVDDNADRLGWSPQQRTQAKAAAWNRNFALQSAEEDKRLKIAVAEKSELAKVQVLGNDWAQSTNPTSFGYLGGLTDTIIPSPTDPSKYVTLSREDRIDAAVSRYNATINARAAEDKLDPATVTKTKMDWFGRQGVTNPEWESQFSAIDFAFSGATLTDEHIPQGLKDAAETFHTIYRGNRTMALKHVDSADTEDFLLRYDAFRDSMSEKDAIRAAAMAHNNKDAIEPPFRHEDLVEIITGSEIGSLVNGVGVETGGLWGSSWFAGTNPAADDPVLQDRVAKKYRSFLSMKKNKDWAMARTKEWIADTHTNINGHAVFTGHKAVPADFQKLVYERLRNYAKTHLAEELEFENLTIQPVGDGSNVGKWRIIDTRSGLPVLDDRENVITAASLMSTRKQLDMIQKKKDDAALEQQRIDFNAAIERDAKRKKRNVYRGPGPDGAPPPPPPPEKPAEPDFPEDPLSLFKSRRENWWVNPYLNK